MKKKFLPLLSFFTAVLLSGCSADAVVAEDSLTANAAYAIEPVEAADLVGTWTIYSMASDVAVDFDQDGVWHQDVLLETSCFDNMYFDFTTDGNVTTTQARLSFDSTGTFSCSQKSYGARYEILGNDLKVHFQVNGVTYSEVKTIAIVDEGGQQFLKISLTAAETDAAVYVADDPGTTVASDIGRLDFVYLKS